MADIPVKRLALIGPQPPPAGGMANQTLQLKHLLEGEGVEVLLVQVNTPYRPAWVGKWRGLRALFRFVAYIPVLWKAASRVDVFHVMANSGLSWHLFAAPAIWVAYLRRIPVVVNYRGGEAEYFFEKSFSWVRPSLIKSSTVIVPSKYLQAVFARWGVDVTVVPNIIDTTLFRRRAERVQEKIASELRIIVCRNLEPIYGIDTAIKSFAIIKKEIPEATLTVTGSGWQLQDLQSLAQSLGLSESIHFTGSLDVEKMADLYQHADIFLNTSRVDNMPNSLIEAMACGVPIVSTNVGGIPYLAEHDKTALLVSPDDEQAAADAVLQLIRTPDTRKALTEQAYEHIQNYTWPRVKVCLFSIYKDICSSGGTVCSGERNRG